MPRVSALWLCLPLAAAAGLWGAGRPAQPACVDIPRGLRLCHGIGYAQMRLPNLLEHDSLAEVTQQAASWLPLLNVRCHGDTRLFLCSLFSPVCLDRDIYPCRSLCEAVRRGCESRMNAYGFPWPAMFHCERFPADNDMCIAPQSSASAADSGCIVCNQVETYENILDNFCRADFVVRTKIRRLRKLKLICKKARALKAGAALGRRPVVAVAACCEERARGWRDALLVMGQRRGAALVATFLMPWDRRSAPLKTAVRMFKKLNCSDPKFLTGMADNIVNTSVVTPIPKKKKLRPSRKNAH